MIVDYKDTLSLPQTKFPMKANLNQMEPEVLRFWKDGSIYRKLQEKNRGGRRYILHDGPPYANGNIHIGHVINKVIKDIIVKYNSMQGHYSPYVPGWDCHGLPVEHQIDKSLGKKREQVNVMEKRRLCREYAGKFVNIQREEFKRLGVFGDWDRPYLTMSYDYEASIVREFFRFVKNGSVYKGKRPVRWCPSCVTALAEAEVEYEEKESPSIFVKFEVIKEGINKYLPQLNSRVKEKLGPEQCPSARTYFVIWTTTPWTLPANLALVVHPELIYVAVAKEEEILIVAEDNLENLRKRLDIKGDVVFAISGKKLEGIRTQHPFIERESKVVTGDFVTIGGGSGSGVVHIAPGHGEEDYEVGLKYGLDIYAPVDDRGRFTKSVPEFEGQSVFKANDGIIERLKERNALLGDERIRHSYPHCWRCKRPVIFRATAQWFISMEKGGLRRKCLEEIEKVEWIPSWGKDRIYGMVSNRPDWCISRQRSWGVPIPLITCNGCDTFIEDEELYSKITSLVEQQGADIWFTVGAEEILDDGYRCSRCGGNSFKKETDILDVWFDSGVSHAAVLERDERLSSPAEMYLEGSDQHRGWFQSSIIVSVGTSGRAPYKAALTHGFAVDSMGRKMSKSLGNVILPQEIIKTNGAEILRLWVSAEDYREDVKISKEIIDRLTEAYKKIRNTARFLLANIYDYDGRDYSEHLLEIDRWAMSRLQGLIKRVASAYESFTFHEVFHSIYDFCIVDMSSFYLDILKDRLYISRADSVERRASQWVLYQILVDMTRLMAPVLSFTAEEVWSYALKWQQAESESIFLSSFPAVREEFIDGRLEMEWSRLISIRNEANKALEIKRKDRFIGNSLEAKLLFYVAEEERDLLETYKDFLPTLFIVSGVKIYPLSQKTPDSYESRKFDSLYIEVERAHGNKCVRCWNWSTTVGKLDDHPGICERCYNVIK
ncbi:isoleucine--tRNA ligase [Thermodesulfovibrionales bacterium]|nr:isoleucine--tRNA ligase [Thermodesulfovibrionales bacterium]